MTTENKLELLNYCKSPYSKEVIAAILGIMFFVSFTLYQQEGVAQLQPQQSTLSNMTATNIENPSEGSSFNIDNATFSHRKTPVNGFLMHYVIGGEGDPSIITKWI
jgi:hypothetical protein